MTAPSVLERGREAFERQAWADAYAQLERADGQMPLAVEDVERLALAASLVGRDDDCIDALARAHQERLRAGDRPSAARCAFWATMHLMNRGEFARGNGWLARGKRVLDEYEGDCVERGYLLVPSALQRLEQGDAAAALDLFQQVADVAHRFGDSDVTAFGRLGRGSALIHLGRIAEGVALLDEVMVAATGGELSPTATGIAYCAVIDACRQTFDLRRAQEWTAALSAWCASQSQLVPFRGQCLLHRAEIMQVHGAWADALNEARQASERLAGHHLAGAAFYQQAELTRLLGDFSRAEDAYRLASQWGHSTQPGLALLRVAQGQTTAADAAIRRALDEVGDRMSRATLLPACVEIMLAAEEADAARLAADELREIANALDAPLLWAEAAQADGAVLLAEGNPRGALLALRQASNYWQELAAPYEGARTRELIGLACRRLGDEDAASMEIAAARETFEELGATADLARVGEKNLPTSRGPDGLTAREVEVLRLVAAGKTNRSIAAAMAISEKTVARHLSNIFAKLGLPSRAAATAYAYEHHLV